MSNSNKVTFIGLTGGIGSGKTTVSDLFLELGVPIIDTDIISHQLSQSIGFLDKVKEIFGVNVFSGDVINREALRLAFFDHHEKKELLEAYIHPLILQESIKQMEAVKSSYAILVVPLLFEKKNFLALVSRTLFVDCSKEMQIERVQKRSHLTVREIENIINQQMSRDEKLQLADDVIKNDQNKKWLTKEVLRLHSFYLDFFN